MVLLKMFTKSKIRYGSLRSSTGIQGKQKRKKKIKKVKGQFFFVSLGRKRTSNAMTNKYLNHLKYPTIENKNASLG